jgi:hypothetical protein
MKIRLSLLALAALALAACPSEKKGDAAGSHSTHDSQAASQPAGHHGDHGGHGKKTGMAPVDRETVDADGVVRRGAKLTDAASLTVSEATAKSGELDGKVVKIEGKVKNVCQPMGCWFVVAGDSADETIRISSKGHDVFVPKNASGRVAVVEGELAVKTLTKEQAQHFEDEKEMKPGEERKVFTEDKKELSLNIIGLELRPAT